MIFFVHFFLFSGHDFSLLINLGNCLPFFSFFLFFFFWLVVCYIFFFNWTSFFNKDI